MDGSNIRFIDPVQTRIAELEAERRRAWKNASWWQDKAGEWLTERDYARAENAALRKALEDAPHGECDCKECGYCTCWKSVIPPQTR